MNQLQTALGIIALLEQIEPSAQAAVLALIRLWQGNNDVKTVLQGEVTALAAIVAKARVEQGLPAVAAPTDPDPAPPAA